MITSEFKGWVARGGGPDTTQVVNLKFAFDDINSPLAIEVTFSGDQVEDGETTWKFSRELILRGSQSFECFGEGDVKFQRMSPDKQAVILCLSSPEGHADVWMPEGPLNRFLEATTDAVPFGSELVDEALDNLIKELLG